MQNLAQLSFFDFENECVTYLDATSVTDVIRLLQRMKVTLVHSVHCAEI